MINHIKHVKDDLTYVYKLILDYRKNNFGQCVPLQINCKYIIIAFIFFVSTNVEGVIILSM